MYHQQPPDPDRLIQIPSTDAVQAGQLVWHYTDTGGLLGILKSDTLWATSMSMLNDTLELKHGIEFLNGYWASERVTRREDWSEEGIHFVDWVLNWGEQIVMGGDCYVACASLDGDSLSSWRGYGGSAGYAVGLRNPFPGPQVLVDGNDNSFYTRAVNRFLTWRKVVYTETAKVELCRWIISHLKERCSGRLPSRTIDEMYVFDAAESTYIGNVANMKHHGFQDEREARLVVFGEDSAIRSSGGGVQYRAGALGVTPYLRITGGDSSEKPGLETMSTSSALPIEVINIGPCKYPDSTEAGLRRLLMDKSPYLDNVLIQRSNVPFR